MASLTFKLDERSSKNGMNQVRIRISNNQTSSYFTTGVYVEKKHFKGNNDSPLDKRAYMYDENNEYLKSSMRLFESAIFDLKRAGTLKDMSANDIRDYTIGKKENVCNGTSFMNFFKEYGEGRRTDKTIESYGYAYRVIEEFLRKNKRTTIVFSQIDYSWLVNFNKYMVQTGRGDSTRHMILCYIRSAYNDAIKRKLVKRDDSPFYDFSIEKPELGEIEYLALPKMRELIKLDLSQYQGSKNLERARDIALISFYLCGMDLKDIYKLPNVDGEEIVWVREKINRYKPKPMHINIEPELKVLIDKYKGKHHLFNFSECNSKYSTFQRNLNERFERLTKLLGAKVNIAVIRRTYATYAGELEVADRVTKKSMGHKDKSTKDKYYEHYDWSRTARANRKIIDYAHARI